MRVAGTHVPLREKNLLEHEANAEATAQEQRETASPGQFSEQLDLVVLEANPTI